MKQKLYKAKTYEEYKKNIDAIEKSAEYASSKSVLVQLYMDVWERESVKEVISYANDTLKKAVVCGMSNGNRGVIINVIYFEKVEISLHKYVMCEEQCELFLGGGMASVLEEERDTKGVLLYAAGIETSIEDFGVMALAQHHEIPVFGAKAVIYNERMDGTVSTYLSRVKSKTASDDNQAQSDNKEGQTEVLNTYIIEKNNIIENGFVAILLKGKDLHIRTGYNFGWTPIGKPMVITEMEGTSTVKTIDNKPATDVYCRYLGLEKHQIISENVCEFPFALDRESRQLARIAVRAGNTDSLNFSAPVYEGDEIRLTYGNEEEIFAESYEDSRGVGEFEPQAIIMIECCNRNILMKKNIIKEYDFYRQYCPELAIVHGHAEILFDEEGGGELNSTLVSVAMREGEKTGNIKEYPTKTQCCPVKNPMVPLAKRMITFLDATTQELQEALYEAKRANKAKTEFFSNVSHEIRTPVNAVLGLDEMILREAEDKNIRRYATDIKNSGKTLLSLINDILDSSRIESGQMEIIPEEYELSSMLNDLVNMTAVRAKEKDLELNVKVAEDIPHILKGDDTRIKQCAVNILTNAVKYTEKGSVTMEVFSEKKEDNHINLSFVISDTGIGIKKEDMDKLFLRFGRIEEDRNRNVEGTGLGMSIVQNLLALMDSELSVSSEYGKGSTFSFTIDQEIINDEPIGDFTEMYKKSIAVAEDFQESFHAPEARVLVVDDTRMNLIVVKGLLKETQVQVDTADSGSDALKMMQKKHFDIIFLDQRMPGMDGLETFGKMKHLYDNKNINTPVIMLTANAVAGAREMYLSKGFSDYLTKPIDGKKLENIIERFLPAEKIIKVEKKDGSTENNAKRNAESNAEDNADRNTQLNADDNAKKNVSEFMTALKGIDEINETEAIKNCMSEDILLESVMDFVASGRKVAAEISRFLAEKDIKNYTIRVHALKSSARIIGAEDISNRALHLEEAGDAGDVEEIEKLTPKLIEDYEKLITKLSLATGEDSDSKDEQSDSNISDDAPEIGLEELYSGFSAIAELTEAFDFDGAMGLVDMLKAYKLAKADKKKLISIADHLRRLERDEIIKIIKETLHS